MYTSATKPSTKCNSRNGLRAVHRNRPTCADDGRATRKEHNMEMMESKIIRIAHLVEFLMDESLPAKAKAIEVKRAIAENIITEDEGLDLIIEYTN